MHGPLNVKCKLVSAFQFVSQFSFAQAPSTRKPTAVLTIPSWLLSVPESS
jgi:hypothetical protein